MSFRGVSAFFFASMYSGTALKHNSPSFEELFLSSSNFNTWDTSCRRMPGLTSNSLSRNFADWSQKYVSGKLSFRWLSSYYLFKRRYESSGINAQRHWIQGGLFVLGKWPKMRFPPRSFVKKDIGEWITALAIWPLQFIDTFGFFLNMHMISIL